MCMTMTAKKNRLIESNYHLIYNLKSLQLNAWIYHVPWKFDIKSRLFISPLHFSLARSFRSLFHSRSLLCANSPAICYFVSKHHQTPTYNYVFLMEKIIKIRQMVKSACCYQRDCVSWFGLTIGFCAAFPFRLLCHLWMAVYFSGYISFCLCRSRLCIYTCIIRTSRLLCYSRHSRCFNCYDFEEIGSVLVAIA